MVLPTSHCSLVFKGKWAESLSACWGLIFFLSRSHLFRNMCRVIMCTASALFSISHCYILLGIMLYQFLL